MKAADPIRRFDAPAPPSAFAVAFATLRAHWGVTIASMFVVGCVACAAAGLRLVDAAWSARLAASIGATRVYVVVDPSTARADAEALGSPIRALSLVEAASFESRDDALAKLVADGLPVPDGKNPLPDVWTVTLRSRFVMADPRGFAAVVGDTRRALAASPHVDATRVDQRWVDGVDRHMRGWRRLRSPLLLAGCALLALLLLATGFLAGAALSDRQVGPMTTRKSAVTLGVALAALVAAAVAMCCMSIVPAWLNDGWSPDVQAPASLFRTDPWVLVAIVAGACLATTIGSGLGAEAWRPGAES